MHRDLNIQYSNHYLISPAERHFHQSQCNWLACCNQLVKWDSSSYCSTFIGTWVLPSQVHWGLNWPLLNWRSANSMPLHQWELLLMTLPVTSVFWLCISNVYNSKPDNKRGHWICVEHSKLEWAPFLQSERPLSAMSVKRKQCFTPSTPKSFHHGRVTSTCSQDSTGTLPVEAAWGICQFT